MGLTDKQLEELKVLDSTAGLTDKYGNEAIRLFIPALIRRLECTERSLELFRTDKDHRFTPEQVESLLAWKLSAGKD